MIVLLLSCGISWSRSSGSFLYGGASDSLLVAYEDIRAANAKMIELKYEKEINARLNDIIHNDSIIISCYDDSLRNVIQTNKIRVRKIKKQRNIASAVGIAGIISTIIVLLK